MARPKETKKDRQPIFALEFNKIIERTKHSKTLRKSTKMKLLRAYTLLFYSGCRVSEIVTFTVDDIAKLVRDQMFVLGSKNQKKTKTKTVQLLRFNKMCCDKISEMDISDCKSALFYKNGSSSSMNAAGLTKLVNEHLSEQLNVLYTTHSFRAGFITSIVEATGNITVAQVLARHRDPKTTAGYLTATPTQIDNALDKVFK